MDELSPFLGVDQLDLRVYSDDEIEKISVMQVTSEEAINQIGHCCRGGLYDQRMGKGLQIYLLGLRSEILYHNYLFSF